MKSLSATLFLVLSFLLISCGKTEQQKQAESDLNKRLMQMHDAGMTKMREAASLSSQLDSALTLHDSLAAKFPKETAGHDSRDIAEAKQKLASARSAMGAWMAAHKPYNVNAKHDEAMTQLNAEIAELTKVGQQLDTAIVDVTGTVENHRKFAAELLAKKPVKRGGR